MEGWAGWIDDRVGGWLVMAVSGGGMSAGDDCGCGVKGILLFWVAVLMGTRGARKPQPRQFNRRAKGSLISTIRSDKTYNLTSVSNCPYSHPSITTSHPFNQHLTTLIIINHRPVHPIEE